MSTGAKLLAVPAVVVLLAAGLWFWSGVVAPGYDSAIVLGIAWFVVVSVALGRLAKKAPGLRWPLRGTFLACAAFAAVGFYWTSVRDTVVDEQIVMGTPASRLPAGGAGVEEALAGGPRATAEDSGAGMPRANVTLLGGPVRPAGHTASGRARVVDLAEGGRRLTLSDGFEIDPGPQVRVYLATDASGGDFVDLGELKGSKGDQQYSIPEGTRLQEYDTVVFWCVPFTQVLATAQLEEA